MSPELRKNRELVAKVPDRNGTWPTPLGPVTVDVNGIHPDLEVQELVLSADWLKGRSGSKTENGTRVIQLSPSGTGSQRLGRGVRLDVVLNETPIRSLASMSRRVVNKLSLGDWSPRSVVHEVAVWKNPHWMRNGSKHR